MLRPWKLEIQLDEQSDKAIYLQIADAVIEDIRSGRLKSGDALPGSRILSAELRVNRNTIVEALQVLLNEGWLVTKERRGTFVPAQLPRFSRAAKPDPKAPAPSLPAGEPHINFDDGHPDSKLAPVGELARAYRQVFNQKARCKMMGYGSEFGDIAFRRAVVQMLNHQRGMKADEESICITRGSQMAMYLTAQCLLKKDDIVVVENPGYKPAWQTFENAGARLLFANVDAEGINVEVIKKHLTAGKKIKAVYITPHHQYPTTVTLSLQRRLELVKLSNTHGFTIIEDDYDNEFHFGYRPVLPVSSLSGIKNYVYIGTMSKVVAPALRIGYLASNVALVKKAGALRKLIDIQGDSIMEQAVLQLINDGTIKRHIRKATGHYRAKRDLTDALLKQFLQNKADHSLPEGGLAFWIVPKKKVDWALAGKKLLAKGIRIITPDSYSRGGNVNGIRLSYGSLSEEQLREGIAALAQFLA
jgi:GntR family transcriptional regulator/MocR family aminotransferase